MALIRTLVLTVAGIAAGFALALWWLQRDEPATAPRETTAPEVAAETRADPQLQSAVVTVHASGNTGLKSGPASFSGLIVGAPDIVIAPAGLVAGADRLRVETHDGTVIAVSAIAASDDIYGLVALQTRDPFAGAAVLEAAAGAGSLFVGRGAELLTAEGVKQIQIASPAQRNELGAYYYETRQRGLAVIDGVALLDPDTAMLIGVPATHLFPVLQSGSEGDGKDAQAAVIDSEPVAALIDAIGRGASRSPAEFSRHYFLETTPGRIAYLRTLVTSGRYAQAIGHGEDIVNLDAYSQEHVPLLLRRAYAALARELIDDGRDNRALARLQNAVSVIGADEELARLQAEALVNLNRHGQAIDALLALREPPVDRIRMIVVEHAMIGGENGANARLIERALQTDPDFAPYHRLLGEHYARLGDMPAAIRSLERATRLDASMNADLAPMLDRLRARRNTPPITEIPIRSRGGTFVVNARINGSQNVYRLMLDTGASYTAISTETALQLGLNQIFLGAPIVELQTANGRIFATTATLQSVDVAGARVDNVEAVILDSAGQVDGLLGQSFLRHFDIEIDRTRNVIVFHRRAN